MSGYKMWAIWNGCQGIFQDTVSYTIEDLEAKLESHSYGQGRIVPVDVTVAPDDDDNWGRWLNANDATADAVQARGGSMSDIDRFDGLRAEPIEPIRIVRGICNRRNVSLGGLATAAGVAPSTLARAMNDPDHKFELSVKTLNKIIAWDNSQP